MDSGNCNNNSNTSSPENDHQPEKPDEDSTGTGRSYECTFCKRGFTNAQALGGHMNIHRKDKAKAKQRNTHQDQGPSTHNIKRNENYANSWFLPQIDHQQQQDRTSYYGYGVEAHHQVYLPSSNPNVQTRGYCSNLPVLRPEISDDHDRVDANLILSIGSAPHAEDGDEKTKENEVDLELRLGHDP